MLSMRYKLISLTIIIILIASCQKIQNQPPTVSNDNKSTASKENSTRTIEFVSMIELLTTPSKYHGKRVGVTGVLSVQFEDTALYFHKDDYTYGIGNAFWLELNEPIPDEWKSLQARYVTVIGTFSTEHQGIVKGLIKNIEAIQLKESRNEAHYKK